MNLVVKSEDVTRVFPDCLVIRSFALSSCKSNRVAGAVSGCGWVQRTTLQVS